MSVLPFKTTEVAVLRIRPEGSNRTIQWSCPLKLVNGKGEDEITINVPIKRGSCVSSESLQLEKRFVVESIPINGQHTIQNIYYPTDGVKKYLAAFLEKDLRKRRHWRKVDFFS